MKKLCLVLALLALAASLPAQTGISGIVTTADSNQPIAYARVYAYPHGGMAITDSTGAYLINHMMPGSYLVGAEACGFQHGAYPDTVVVVQDQVTPDINIALQPGQQPPPPPPGSGSIAGHVEDALTQQPIPLALVGTDCEYEHGEHHGDGFFALTDSNGDYIIDHVVAGKYIVSARAWGYEWAVFPDTVTVVDSQATPDINFALQPEVPNSGAIAGRVTDDSGNLISRVVVKASSGDFHRMALQGHDGYTISHLPAGTYWVEGFAEGYAPGNYPDSVVVTAGQTTDHVDFSLTQSVPEFGGISGVVTNAQSQEPIQFALVSAGGEHGAYAITDSLGAYQIDHVQPGTYAVTAFARGFVPAAPESTVVTAGQITPNINFALEPQSNPGFGVISGTITDSATGYAVFPAGVFAWGASGQGFARDDSSGGYGLEHLPAGTYVVRAFARGYYPATYPETLTVAVGETLLNIDFALSPLQPLNAGFAGFVFNGLSQTEVPSVHLTAIGVDGSYEVAANSRGDYVFDNLTAGDYVLQLEADGYGSEFCFNPVSVQQAQLSVLTSPAVYPLNGIAEAPKSHASARVSLAVRPNPISSQASVSYSLPCAGSVSLKLYDVTGKLVMTLARGNLTAGSYSTRIDANGLAKGVYLLKLTATSGDATRKVVVR
jgi:hypothetical protein